MADYGDAPPELTERVRRICAAFPEAYEHDAWAGARWRIRQHTFAHVLSVPADHLVARDHRRPSVLIVRAPEDELEALRHAGPPYFTTPWGHNVIGLRLDEDTDWAEVAELITDSYRVQAPAKLAVLVDQPPPPPREP